MKRTSSLFSLVLMLSLLLMLTTFVVAGASAPDDGPWVYGTELPAQAVRFDTEFYNGKMYMLGYRTPDGAVTDGSVWAFGRLTLPSTPGATQAWICLYPSPTTPSQS